MTDFLLELRSEEIPARMQDKAREDLAKLFTAELAKSGIAATVIETYATPRRLALIARDLPLETAAVSEETKGPKTSAPPQALEGFLRKTGLAREQLTERDGVLFAVIDKAGRATAAVLAEAIPAIIRAFPWPKSMRWGAASASTESLKWVRPLQGIVALLGEDVVECEIAGIASGAATVGHRFHHPGIITIGSASDYAEKLRACHVIVDQAERQSIIALGATMLAAKAGLTLIRDEGLLVENAGLTEWPVPLLGRFDEAFLSVPPEVIQLTVRVNQKYFVCQNADGKLANAFICTANIDAADGGAKIIEGNRKVLAARLSDATFFWEQDLKVPLAEQAKKLDRIVFHEKLGTVADKVERVAKLARWLVEEGIVPPKGACSDDAFPGEGRGPDSARSADSRAAARVVDKGLDPGLRRGTIAQMAYDAARLCKADLVTGMVGEFPELQGLMGGYYAAAQGEDPRAAAAIRDHYKPVGQGDDVPTAPVTVAVSLADKLDTIFSFAAANMMPTGSSDPFAIRRAAIGVLRLLNQSQLRLSFNDIIQPWYKALSLMRLGSADDMIFLGSMLTLTVHDGPYSEHLSTIYPINEDRSDWLDCALISMEPDSLPFREQLTSEDLATGFIDIYRTPREIVERLAAFFADRLKVQQREAGVRHDLIDAVFALGGEDDLVRLLARVHALQSFIATPDGTNLLAGYKRAANILKKEGVLTPSPPVGEGRGPSRSDGKGEGDLANVPDLTPPHPSVASLLPPSPTGGEGKISLSYTPEPAETALLAALDVAAPRATAAVAAEDFEGAMAALASLRAPIDTFFDTVIVNDPDAAKRAARLALLARVRDAVHAVADFSKIEG